MNVSAPSIRRSSRLFPLLCSCLVFASFASRLDAITLTGANGKAVEFHLIKSATPKGITAQMVPDGPVIGITWDKLDLAALERDQKAIHDAYLRAKAGETVELNLDKNSPGGPSSPGAAPSPGPAVAKEPPPRFPGWIEAKVGSATYYLQLPAGKPLGILLVSVGDFGQSFELLSNHQRGSGPWGEFQNKHQLALVTYDLPRARENPDPTVIDEFVFAHKGSGKVFEAALKDLGVKAKQPDFAALPILVYGAERTGAAFAYNLVQTIPERIVAAAVCKGAFYDAEATPASMKVPMLFIWGQYSNQHEIWKSPNHAEPVLEKVAALNSNWTNGREFRGQGDMNAVVEHFGKKYLLELVALRIPKNGAPSPAVPPEAKPEGESKPAADGGEGKSEKTPEPPPAQSSASAALTELDRSKGYRGNLATGELLKIEDPAAPLGEDETFLPDEAVGKLWKKFIEGELEAPAPKVAP